MLCTTPACFSTFFRSTIVPTMVENSYFLVDLLILKPYNCLCATKTHNGFPFTVQDTEHPPPLRVILNFLPPIL